jgi:RimJ/RimL family protein N-acetyltransferase
LRLKTERLVLRPLTEADAPGLFELDNDPEVMRYINGGRPTTPEVVRRETLPRLLSCYSRPPGFGYWAAEEDATGSFLGWFELRPLQGDASLVELGYRLRTSAWGMGYATEGSKALLSKGFLEFGVEQVVAFTMAVNTASRRVLEKAGLTCVRSFFEDWPDRIPGAEHGDVEYRLDRPDWERLRATQSC